MSGKESKTGKSDFGYLTPAQQYRNLMKRDKRSSLMNGWIFTALSAFCILMRIFTGIPVYFTFAAMLLASQALIYFSRWKHCKFFCLAWFVIMGLFLYAFGQYAAFYYVFGIICMFLVFIPPFRQWVWKLHKKWEDKRKAKLAAKAGLVIGPSQSTEAYGGSAAPKSEIPAAYEPYLNEMKKDLDAMDASILKLEELLDKLFANSTLTKNRYLGIISKARETLEENYKNARQTAMLYASGAPTEERIDILRQHAAESSRILESYGKVIDALLELSRSDLLAKTDSVSPLLDDLAKTTSLYQH